VERRGNKNASSPILSVVRRDFYYLGLRGKGGGGGGEAQRLERNRVARSLRDSGMPRERTKPPLHREQYIIPEVKNVPLLSNSPYLARARDKSITR